MPVLAGPEPWGLRPTDWQGAGRPDSPWLTGIQAAYTAAPYAVRFDLSYAYPAAGQDTGRIAAETRTAGATSTRVDYSYDAYNRLATAVSTTGGNTNWGLGFSYDVYGNRTAQTVTAGSAPAFSATFGSNNRMVGYSYDNNGNQLNTADGATLEYDWDNRMTKWTKQGQTEEYRYHPAGWRLSNSNDGSYLYGPGGQLLTKSATRYTDYVYFAGRLLFTMSEGQMDPRLTRLTRVYSDRLGSTRATTVTTYGGGSTTRNYYPFGEEITSTANNQYKYASTYRDSATGLDYAVNRYYASGTGRFLSADPYKASGGPASPQSWNRYSYVHGDPVNFIDRNGTNEAPAYGCEWNGEFWVCDWGLGGGGGGTWDDPGFSPPPDPSSGPQSRFGPCNRGGSAQEDSNLSFVADNYGNATAAAGGLGISSSWLLGWSAEESGWGQSAIARQNGNYFNMSAPSGTGGWQGAVACSAGAVAGWACFNSFAGSLNAALQTTHATWNYPGIANPSAAQVISAVLLANPNASASEVFQAVADAGFDPVGTSTNAGYGSRVQGRAGDVQRRVDCLRDNGYLN